MPTAAETDYPPTANAGSNVIVSLPQNSVTLFGNASTDDKGIVSYEWTRTSDDKLAVDMVVSIKSWFLHLILMEEDWAIFSIIIIIPIMIIQ